jgi:hypothetical protein
MKKLLTLTAVIATAGLVHATITPIEGNTVGLMKVAVAGGGTNTIISVPFEQCLGGGASGMLKDLVATTGLTSHASDPASADQLIVLTTNGADRVYYYYWLKSTGGWTPSKTYKVVDGTEVVFTPPAASAFPIARGLGFWIKRTGSAADVYLKGQVATANQATVITNGLNLVGYAYSEGLTLNDPLVSWAGANGGSGNTVTSDKIMVVNDNGTFSEYFYFVKPAAWPNELRGVDYSALSGKWINNNYTAASVTIPAGKGFWYLRRGTAGFTFKPKGE